MQKISLPIFPLRVVVLAAVALLLFAVPALTIQAQSASDVVMVLPFENTSNRPECTNCAAQDAT